MVQRIKSLFSYSVFLKRLIQINLKLRYHGTYFGFFWTMLNAFCMITIFTFVFGYILKVPLENFPVFLFCGYLPWLFFSSCMINSCYALLKNHNLIQKIYFPREITVIAETVSQFLVYLSSLSIFLLVFGFFGKLNFGFSLLVYLPLLLLIQLLVSFGSGLLLALVNVYFRDVAYFVEILVTIWFYLTPIFYPLSWVPERVAFLIRLNPVTYIIEAYRMLFYHGYSFNMLLLIYPAVYGIILTAAGYRVFMLYEQQISEEI